MNNFNNIDLVTNYLDEAYKCKPADLETLLKKIEFEIKNSDHTDKTLLRAKTIVTSKLALHYSK